MQLPFRINDLLLLIVVLSSLAAGTVFPNFSSLFQSLPIYCLMVLFALSYLSIELDIVWRTLKDHSKTILAFTVLKSLILPVAVFYIFKVIAPTYALSALLLIGVSTGVVAPFISNLVKGNSPLVLVVVVITSVLVPITLPALIHVVAARYAELSLIAMIRMLMLVIFVPILVVECLRRLTPGLLKHLMKRQFPLSLLLFAIINLGIFCRYSPLFKKDPSIIITASAVAVVLAAICCTVGILFFWKSSVENQLAGAVMLGNMNNVLVIVFSSEFFGPIEPIVAAMYIIPFFGLVMPLRYYSHWRARAADGSVRNQDNHPSDK
ncbi:MAG: bile acid:sodium symporter family protein [Syntrophales bacterium]